VIDISICWFSVTELKNQHVEMSVTACDAKHEFSTSLPQSELWRKWHVEMSVTVCDGTLIFLTYDLLV
jgi:hypothetical protein